MNVLDYHVELRDTRLLSAEAAGGAFTLTFDHPWVYRTDKTLKKSSAWRQVAKLQLKCPQSSVAVCGVPLTVDEIDIRFGRQAFHGTCPATFDVDQNVAIAIRAGGTYLQFQAAGARLVLEGERRDYSEYCLPDG